MNQMTEKEVRIYKAFGLIISSDHKLFRLPFEKNEQRTDVCIHTSDNAARISESECCFSLARPGIGSFCIAHGQDIIYVPSSVNDQPGVVSTILLGVCMGAILHQRGEFVLHGSCVTRNGKTILVTGVSGAGKSTLAAEFLKNGWEMVTDDIAVIRGIEEGRPMVQSSYPSQKLWEDATERYDIASDKQTLLYTEDDRSKMNVQIDHFHEGLSPLTDVVCLYPTEQESAVVPVTGIAVVDQLMRNTYRPYMIPASQRQRHFQRCVTLSGQIRMHAVLRAKDRNTAPELYEKIIRATEA